MILRQKQSLFAKKLALLLMYAYEIGYEVTLGDAYAHDGHMENSLHYERLAIDLNLFRNGRYLTKTEHYESLGLFWESIGGSWGGRFDDGNHFSLAHGGRK